MMEIEKVKVLIADDHVLYRWGLMEALDREESIEVVEEASDGNEAVAKALALKPHVVLMDLGMPVCDGVEATRRLQTEAPEISVLINTVSDKEEHLVEALKAGARGYLLKDEKPDNIVQAILYVARGGIIVAPAMTAKLLSELRSHGHSIERGTMMATGAPAPKAAVEPSSAPAQEQPSTKAAADADEADKVDSTPAAVRNAAIVSTDLVISPPVEPSTVLRLHKWLKEVAKAEIERINSSLEGDTVLKVNFRQATSLRQMLAKLTYLAKVTDEPQPSVPEALPGASAKPQPERVRYRLVLRAE